MKFETKINRSGGSLVSSLPSTLVKILEIEKGDSLEWTVDVKADGTTICLSKKE